MNDDLLEKLLQSKKYRDVCPDTVRRIWGECAAKHKKPKDAERAAREALHGITGAFMTPAEAAGCAADIRAWHGGARGDEQLERLLKWHASTRERLPLSAMDALYARIFALTGTPGHVLDLACGINPIYLAARGVRTTGVDISGEAVRLINAFGMPADAVCGDLLCRLPEGRHDVALLFKALPLLERQRRGAAADVLRAIDARCIVASFPTRTLGGRNVGMAGHYAAWMAEQLPDNRRIVGMFEIENEMFYILEERN